MAKRTTRRQAARWLAYCNRELLNADLSDGRRRILEEKASVYRRQLAGSCSECGRPLENDQSLELGIGPECRAKLDQGDVDDREYDRATANELSMR